jgi:hypothetical protein
MAAVTLTVKISKLAPPEKATMVSCMNHASFQEDLALLNETKSCLVTRNIVNFDWPCTEVMLKCQVFGILTWPLALLFSKCHYNIYQTSLEYWNQHNLSTTKHFNTLVNNSYISNQSW